MTKTYSREFASAVALMFSTIEDYPDVKPGWYFNSPNGTWYFLAPMGELQEITSTRASDFLYHMADTNLIEPPPF